MSIYVYVYMSRVIQEKLPDKIAISPDSHLPCGIYKESIKKILILTMTTRTIPNMNRRNKNDVKMEIMETVSFVRCINHPSDVFFFIIARWDIVLNIKSTRY